MIKHKKIFMTCVVILIAVGFYILRFNLPNSRHEQTLLALGNLGINTDYISKPQTHINKVQYENAQLDTDNFSAIKQITALGNPLRLNIDGINLTGDYHDRTLSVSGWNTLDIQLKSLIDHTDNITIKNGTLTILTELFGGISFNFNGKLQSSKDISTLDFILESIQKNISFKSNGSGEINNNGAITLDINFEQGRLSSPNLSGNRINGSININQLNKNKINVLCSYSLGNLEIYGFAMQNAVGSIEKSKDEIIMLIDAKSTGSDEVEISLSLQEKENNKRGASITLFSENTKGNAIYNYIKNHSPWQLPEEVFERFKNINTIRIDLGLSDPNLLHYRIRGETEDNNYLGTITKK